MAEPMSEAREERTDADYAIEHGEYLADAAQQYLDAKNAFDMAKAKYTDEVPNVDALSDCHQALRSAIFNFRKRAERYRAGLASRQASVEDWQDAIKWNPYNKVVQDHRDGTIHVVATNAVRAVLGLPVPWTQGMGDADAFKEIEGKLSPLAATPEVTE